MRELTPDENAAQEAAVEALKRLAQAIHRHPGTGQCRRLVRFIAGCYCGSDYPFDLTDLRALDKNLARDCLIYLAYDRLCIREIHEHLPGGEQSLHVWLRTYGIKRDSLNKVAS